MLTLFVLDLEQDWVWKGPVCCTRVKARLLCDGQWHGLCTLRAHLLEPSDGERGNATSYSHRHKHEEV